MKQGGYVYILASQRKGTLYIGVTADLARRINQHRSGQGGEFTRRYGVYSLVYYEHLKGWQRLWKIELIEGMNPDWRDLYIDLAK